MTRPKAAEKTPEINSDAKNDEDINNYSPASSVASYASSAASSRYATRRAEKKLANLSKIEDSAETMSSSRKYNLRSKGTTAQLIDEIEKRETTSTPNAALTRKSRVTKKPKAVDDTGDENKLKLASIHFSFVINRSFFNNEFYP